MNKEEILNTFLLANIPEIITQEEFDDVKKAIKDLQQENQELKKQLEATEEIVETHMKKWKAMENQQKEFINYLEDEIKRINPKELNIGELNLRLDDIKFTQYLTYKEVLQKYKEIIGDKE